MQNLARIVEGNDSGWALESCPHRRLMTGPLQMDRPMTSEKSMTVTQEATETKATDAAADLGSAPLLLSIREVATALGCSVRHVRRLIDSGRMPRPLKLGALLRWRRAAIEQWIEGGCREPRKC